MNKLSRDRQIQVLSALVEGASIRSTERMTSVHRDTITRLLVRAGTSCQKHLDERMRGLECRHLQLDEIWCYVRKKQRRLRDGGGCH